MNKIWFEEWSDYEVGVSRQHVTDVVNALFRFESEFIIHGRMRSDRSSRGLLGLHVSPGLFGLIERHEIFLSPEKIRSNFEAGHPGGGNTRAPTYEIALCKTLAHEIQHANQYYIHMSRADSFYGKKRSRYRTRPSERDARQFADDSVPIIAAILGVELARPNVVSIDEGELCDIVESLAMVDHVMVSDIAEELRLSGANNATNVYRVQLALEKRGVRVCVRQ